MTEAVIGRFVLEVSLASEDLAQQVEDGLLRGLSHDRLVSILEECLAELPEPTQPVVIDRLEVDLGEWALAASPDALAEKSKQMIAEQLQKLLHTAPTASEPGPQKAAGTAAVGALAHFLRFGTLHWSRGSASSVRSLVEEALAAEPEAVAGLLRRSLAAPRVAARLASHLPQAMLARVAGTVSPGAGAWLADLFQLVLDLDRRSPLQASLLPVSGPMAAGVLLQTAARLGLSGGSRQQAVALYLDAMASALQLEPRALKAGIAARLAHGRAAAPVPDGLARAIMEAGGPAADRSVAEPAGAVAARAYPGLRGREAVEAVVAYLQTGAVPHPARPGSAEPVGEGLLRRALRDWLRGGAESAAARMAMAPLLSGNVGAAAALGRLRRLLPAAEAESLLRWLGSDDASPPVRPALPVAGRDAADNDLVQASGQAVSVRDPDLALFWFVMEFGALPWWGRKIAAGSVDSWIFTLVAGRAADLAAALRGFAEHRRALLIERMAARLAAPVLARLAAASQPAFAPDVGPWLAQAPVISGRMSVGRNAEPDREVSLGVSAGRAGSGLALSANRLLQAMAAALLGRLFDPHAPHAAWPELRDEVSTVAARRLGLDRETFQQVVAGQADTPEQAGMAPAARDPEGHLSGDSAGGPGREHGEEVAADADADFAVVERFVSPALQLSVEVGDVGVILADPARRRALAQRLTAQQADTLASRLASGQPALRVAVLEGLAQSVQAIIASITPAQWQREVSERLLQALSRIMQGRPAAETSAGAVLQALLRQQAVRYQRAYPDFVFALSQAVARSGGAHPLLIGLVQALAAEVAREPPPALPDRGQPTAAPHGNEGTAAAPGDGVSPEWGGQEETLRLGLPGADRIDEPKLLAGFLAMPESATGWRRASQSVRQVLRDAVRREVLAARVPIPQLDQLAIRLGGQGGLLLPGTIPTLAAMVNEFAPGAGSQGWVQATIGQVLGGLAGAAGSDAPARITAQLRLIMIRLARDEGVEYPALMRSLAAAGGRQQTALPTDVRQALTLLAGAAAADAPVGARPREPARQVPREAVHAPGASAENALRATAQRSGQALVEAFLGGDAQAGLALRRQLADPLARIRLREGLPLDLLDRLAQAWGPLGSGGIRPSDLVRLAPLAAAAAPPVTALNWQRLMVTVILARLAGGTDEQAAEISHRAVLLEALGAVAAMAQEMMAAAALADSILRNAQSAGVTLPGALAAVLASIAGAGSGGTAQAEAGLQDADANREIAQAGASSGQPGSVAEADFDLVARFVSPALQLSVELGAVVAILADPVRRRTVAGRLQAQQIETLAERLAPGQQALRLSVLGSLAQAVHDIPGSVSIGEWQRAVADGLMQALSRIAHGVSGEAVSAAGVLRRLLQQHAVQNSMAYPDVVIVLAEAVERVEGTHRLAVEALQALAGDGEQEQGQEQGLVVRGRDSEPALLTRFLAMTEGASDWQRTMQSVQQAIGDPVRRREWAAAVPPDRLDRLAGRLDEHGRHDGRLLPGTIQALAVAVRDIARRAVSQAAIVAAIAQALGELADGSGEDGAGMEAQVRRVISAFASDAGVAFEDVILPLAARDFRQPMALPPEVQEAVIALAQPVEHTEPAGHILAGLDDGERELLVEAAVKAAGLSSVLRLRDFAFLGQLVARAARGVDQDAYLNRAAAALLAQASAQTAVHAADDRAGGAEAGRTEGRGDGVAGGGDGLNPGNAALSALRTVAAEHELDLPDLLHAVLAAPGWPRLPVADRIRETLSAMAGDQLPGDQPSGEQSSGDQRGEAPPANRGDAAVETPEIWPWKPDDDAPPSQPRDLIFVQNAGVVLLWPFLTHYFDRVGLLTDGAFPSEEAAARGCMLIHYMAADTVETEEPQLALPKLLCGVPFETPVAPHIELTEIEKTVSEELLNVVCQNWPPMRNSSVDALRETFLLREGSITWLEERIWMLNVSPKPFDMLLGQLPWTLSTFKTALMQHPMMVQWGK